MIGIMFDLQINTRRTDIVKISLFIHEHGISIYLGL